MKLSLNTDFTKFPRAVSIAPAGTASGEIAGRAVLPHDERHLRRRAIELTEGVVEGGKVLVDLPEPVTLADGDRLVLEDGRQIEISAAPEELYDIRAHDAVHLAELAWHIGNRHLAAAIRADRILILRDHVIKAMLEGLGATVTDVVEPFTPVRGAYSGHGHAHDHHDHGHDHSHPDHDHGERDAYGRLPDDPHYGHNHA
ncbi:urease accessory protein UreE [Mesorhizobium sp. KR9-304]|uniref:urease accessory protein UreE n=1 Tax=Mesorhizobium sp. KR9-304 TaxID=3156614 RepID=UPI0032B60354